MFNSILFRAITNDFNDDGEGPITSAKIIDNLRKIMNDTNVVGVPIQAYIVQSVDAHQVQFFLDIFFLLLFANYVNVVF